MDESTIDVRTKGIVPARHELDAAIARLVPEERSMMLDELLDAIYGSDDDGVAGPIADVVRAWYVDARVTTRPGFAERLAHADAREVTQAELLERAAGPRHQ